MQIFALMELPNLGETGSIPIKYLKRFWARQTQTSEDKSSHLFEEERKFDKPLLDSLGIGLGPTISYLFQECPSFAEFENWIIQNGHLDTRKHLIDQFNFLVSDQSNNDIEPGPSVLSDDDIEHFRREGYVIVKKAIDEHACQKTLDIFERLLQIDLNDNSTWYQNHPIRHGVMVEYFQDMQLEENRLSQKVRFAFEQLWERQVLWPSTDRISFNPPQTDQWQFYSPFLHLDIEPEAPLPFGTQGLIYLTDTSKDQGAFQLIPGFHHRINEWIEKEENPTSGNFPSEEALPIEAEMGDLIIWHHGLPHGSSPNRSNKPRFVQYINYYGI